MTDNTSDLTIEELQKRKLVIASEIIANLNDLLVSLLEFKPWSDFIKNSADLIVLNQPLQTPSDIRLKIKQSGVLHFKIQKTKWPENHVFQKYLDIIIDALLVIYDLP